MSLADTLAPAQVAPVLLTPRLRLRPHRPGDLEACGRMWADEAVARFIGGRPSTRDETWGRILRYAGLWSLMGFGYWAVERLSDGLFVGDVGFGEFRREISPSMEGVPEMGWAIAPAAHGRGLASEAVAAALAWLDPRFPASVCIIAPENGPSIRVAAKAGFRELAWTSFRGDPTIMYRRERP